jgi:hypothetical protein
MRVVGAASMLRASFIPTGSSSTCSPGEELIAPIVDIVDGVAQLDETQRQKQPDWRYDAIDSGKAPAARLAAAHAEPHDLIVPRLEHP